MNSISFNPDDTVAVDGPIFENVPLEIHYHPDRLPRCRQPTGLWGIAIFYRFHPGDVLIFSDGWSSGDQTGSGFFVPRSIPVPRNANKIEMWFENTDESGCVAFDNNFGQNYTFDVVPFQK